MPDHHPAIEQIIHELDAAVDGHMQWGQRAFRCALTHEAPGPDMLDLSAHKLCRLGRWLDAYQPVLNSIDLQNGLTVATTHHAMHDAMRSILEKSLAGETVDQSQLTAFEQAQADLIKLLAHFKTKLVSDAIRHDPLTGLPLRHGIENDFSEFQKACQRNNALFYIAMIDVDHFKKVNDRYGHPVGDMALRHLAHTLQNTIRGNAPLYRFGGEEFLWLLQSHSAAEAAQATQRLIDTVRTTPLPRTQGTSIALSVTVGLTCVDNDDDLNRAIQRADKALYEGKRAGRDRYVLLNP